jgi:hypothetical protein
MSKVATKKTSAKAKAGQIASEALADARSAAEGTTVTVKAPDIRTAVFKIRGTAPYVSNRFANKADIMLRQQEGSTAKKGKARQAKDFDANCEAAKHVCTWDPRVVQARAIPASEAKKTWCGIPAPAFRAGMISACRLVGFKMTMAKMSVFIEADGLDQDGCPCIRIEGTPEMHTGHVRNQTGVIDIRARPMWREWSATLRVRFDAEQFTVDDISNLLVRVGIQVGVGEGRPDSKSSAGMGWGTFTTVE